MPSLSQPVLTDFSFGEVTPKVKGRFDTEGYLKMLETCENWIVQKQGGLLRRPGSRFVKAVIDSTKKSVTIPVIFSRTEAYVLELSNLKGSLFRFDGSGVPEQTDTIVTPWLEAELDDVDYAVLDDSIYLVHENHPPVRLKRVAYDDWVVISFDDAGQLLTPEAEDIPTAVSQSQNAIKVPYVSATEQGKVLFFDGAKITAKDTIAVGGSQVIADFKETQLATTTDHATAIDIVATAPLTFTTADIGSIIKSVGEFPEGPDGYKGYYIITAYTNSTTVKGKLLTTSATDPKADGARAITRWSAWHGARSSFPRTVCEFENRLLFGGVGGSGFSPGLDLRIWGSVPEDFTNMDNGIAFGNLTAASSYSYGLSGRIGGGKIQWLRPARVLLVGGDLEEFRILPGISGTSVDVKRQTFYGSLGPNALEINNAIHFLQRNGETMRRLQFSDTIDNYDAADLNIVADHMLEGGAVSPTFQLNPYSAFWLVRADGQIVGATIVPQSGMLAWCRIVTRADEFESAAVIPSYDGKTDTLWVSVKRTVNGATVRYIEVFEINLNTDSAVTYSGGATATITAAHLIGETVDVKSDGVYRGEYVVNGDGEVILPATFTTAELGLPFDATGLTMPIPANPGSAKRFATPQVRVLDTVGISINGEKITFLKTGDAMDQAPPPFTGTKKILNLGWDEEAQIEIKSDSPYNAHVLNISGRLFVGD